MNDHEQGLIPSKRFDVWSRLYARYLLEPDPLLRSRAAVGLAVMPITNADELLQVPAIQADTSEPTVNVLTAVLTVPLGERWNIETWDVVRVDGDRTLAAIGLIAPDGGTILLERFSGTTVTTRLLPRPLKLDELWAFALFVEANTTDGDWTTELFAQVESAF